MRVPGLGTQVATHHGFDELGLGQTQLPVQVLLGAFLFHELVDLFSFGLACLLRHRLVVVVADVVKHHGEFTRGHRARHVAVNGGEQELGRFGLAARGGVIFKRMLSHLIHDAHRHHDQDDHRRRGQKVCLVVHFREARRPHDRQEVKLREFQLLQPLEVRGRPRNSKQFGERAADLGIIHLDGDQHQKFSPHGAVLFSQFFQPPALGADHKRENENHRQDDTNFHADVRRVALFATTHLHQVSAGTHAAQRGDVFVFFVPRLASVVDARFGPPGALAEGVR